MLRNPELRRALLLGGLVTLLASAAAALLSGWRAACVTLALGVVLLGLYTVDLCRHYRKCDGEKQAAQGCTAAAISIWPIMARARSACCAARCAK